jgi:hypothetical protein
MTNIDELVKSLFKRHPGESRGPEHLEITGFRLSPDEFYGISTFYETINIESAIDFIISYTKTKAGISE